MKIVFNTDQIHLHGGIEKVMATKANHFASLPGVEVFIVTAEQKGLAPCYTLDERIRLIDLAVDYDRTQSYFSGGNLLKAVKHFRSQKKLFRDLSPDVIISPNFNFDHYWLPFIEGKAKLLKERHSSRYSEEDQRKSPSIASRIWFRINDWIESRYDHIVVLNADEKKYVLTGNAVVIPNPVALQSITAELKNKKVTAAGRISPVKNFGDLIRAWAIVHRTYPDWQLDIYGEDYLDTKRELENLVNSLGLEQTVNFPGTTDRMTEKMSEYALYAMTSETECFPMVLLEALSVGVPVVSYDCPNGPRNIVMHGSDGLISPHHDVELLAESLLRLMGDEELRQDMGRAAKQNVLRFGTPHVMKQWQKLLNLPDV